MSPKKGAQRSPKKTAASKKKSGGFTAEERAAMRERAKELKMASTREAGEQALREKVAELPKADRTMAGRLHKIITDTAPDLMPRTWYGMPAYAKDDKVVCYFTPASKFKERYASFGFNASANLDQGNMWPTAFALTKLTSAEEKKIAALVKKAVR